MYNPTIYKIIYALALLISGIYYGEVLAQNSYSKENICLQTDRDIYIAGENVFYNVNILNDSSEKIKSNVCYIVLRDNDHIYSKFFIKTDNGNAYSSFYLSDTLKTGYYEIVGFTNYMRNFGDEFYFKKNIIVVNRFDELFNNLKSSLSITNTNISENSSIDLKIEMLKDSFKTREKINVNLILGEAFKSKAHKDITITVKALTPILKENKVKSPASKSPIFYPKETNGIYLDGAITMKDSTPIANECLYLSTPDTFPNLQYVYSDSLGRFQFYLSDYYLGKKLIISTKEKRLASPLLSINDKYFLESKMEKVSINIDQNLRRYILDSQNILKIQKLYNLNNEKKLEKKNSFSSLPIIYENPSSTIIPANFQVLNNLNEIADNIIPDLKIKKIQGEYLPFIVNDATSYFFKEPPLLFLNGVPINNLNELMGLKSGDISKIELNKNKRVKGNISFSGVVSIITPGLEVFPVNSIQYSLDRANEFSHYTSPSYSPNIVKTPLPDFRRLLFWNPSFDVFSNTHFEFYSSDWPGEYIIEITYITKEKQTVKVYSNFVVYDK